MTEMGDTVIDESKLTALLVRLDATIVIQRNKIRELDTAPMPHWIPGLAEIRAVQLTVEVEALETITEALRDAGVQSAIGATGPPTEATSSDHGAPGDTCGYRSGPYTCVLRYGHPVKWNHQLTTLVQVAADACPYTTEEWHAEYECLHLAEHVWSHKPREMPDA